MVSNQEAADKAARKMIRLAYKTGGTVSFSLSRLLSLGVSLKVAMSVYKG